MSHGHSKFSRAIYTIRLPFTVLSLRRGLPQCMWRWEGNSEEFILSFHMWIWDNVFIPGGSTERTTVGKEQEIHKSTSPEGHTITICWDLSSAFAPLHT